MRVKWIIGWAATVVCVAAWAGVAAGFALKAKLAALTALATVAAFSLEGMFWAWAFVLGVSVLQARHRLWGWIAGPFRRKA
jgi:hypothetical protein